MKDRCPGALSLHEAADGLLARIRLPGGRIAPDALAGLSALSAGPLELTSRGNLQVRGVADAAALADGVAALGLLPSASHERVRNVVASPAAALDDLVAALDEAVIATPELAELSGRFLFGLDDGGGDVVALRPDAWAVASGGGWWVAPAGVVVRRDEVVAELVAAARAFAGAPEWRVADLADGGAALAAGLRGVRVPVACPDVPADPLPAGRPVPLGLLTREAVAALAAAERIVLTPRRTVVAGGLVEWPLSADPAWGLVSACAGKPGCAKALADVRADAAAAVARGEIRARTHLAGCERRCGRPAGQHVEWVATGSGYAVAAAGPDAAAQNGPAAASDEAAHAAAPRAGAAR